MIWREIGMSAFRDDDCQCSSSSLLQNIKLGEVENKENCTVTDCVETIAHIPLVVNAFSSSIIASE